MREAKLLSSGPIALAEIKTPSRLRPVTEAGVASLVASITELGVMKDPIQLRRVKHRGGALELIAGAHRLEAARHLSWAEIPAQVWDCTDDWARLMEIDDNLAGAEMCALDTAIFLAERKRVYEKLHPETKATAFKGNRHTGSLAADMMSVASFATATAEKFGLTDRHVRRMISAGEKLDPRDVGLLRAAPRPVTLADLQALSKVQGAAERYHVVEALAEGRVKNAATARREFAARERGETTAKRDPVEAQFNDLLKAWGRAKSTVARRRFVREVYSELTPLVMDESSVVGDKVVLFEPPREKKAGGKG